jgi:hypothetical protein
VFKLTTLLPKLLLVKPAWAVYRAEDFNAVTQQLLDSSINGRHATCTNCSLLTTTGFGANTNIPSVVGGTTSTILFPVGSIPPTFTMFAITRYTSATTGIQRILTSTGEGGNAGNFLFGHWQGNYPRTFYFSGHMVSNSAITTPLTNFCNLGYSTASTQPNNAIFNGAAIGTANKASTGGTVTARLSVNLFNTSTAPSETSEFALSQLIIWDSELTTAEMLNVSNAFTFYLNNGYY